jgi:hypothetical protein
MGLKFGKNFTKNINIRLTYKINFLDFMKGFTDITVRAKFLQVYLTRAYRNGRIRSIAIRINGKPKDEGGEIIKMISNWFIKIQSLI